MRRLLLPGLTAQSSRLLLFNAIFSIALFGVVDVLLNFYFVSLGYTEEAIGLLQSLPRVGGLIAAFLVVPLTSRLRASTVLIVTTIGAAVAQAMIVLIPTTEVIVLSRAALGLTFGIQQIAINPIASALTERENQSRMFGYLSMTSNVAGSIGGFIGGFMPAWIAFLFPTLAIFGDVAPEQTPFAYGTAIFIASVVTGLAVIPIMRLVVPGAALPTGEKPTPQHVPWRTLIPRGIPMMFFGVTGGLTFPFYSLFFRNVHDAPDALVGTILSFGYFMMAFPVLLVPRLERRFGRSATLLVSMGAAGLCFVGLGLSTGIGAATLFFVCGISIRNIVNGIYPPMLLEGLPTRVHNTASSVGFVGWNLGWLMGTTFGGFLTARIGYGTLLQFVGLGVFMIGVSAWWIFRREASAASRQAVGAPLPVTPSEP